MMSAQFGCLLPAVDGTQTIANDDQLQLGVHLIMTVKIFGLLLTLLITWWIIEIKVYFEYSSSMHQPEDAFLHS